MQLPGGRRRRCLITLLAVLCATSATAQVAVQQSRLSPLLPSSPPAKVFPRPRIGLALGGGGALGLTEIGVLFWFEEHHIPVDVIAGTSMGCLISSLYSTGTTPIQLSHVVNNSVFTSVFTFAEAYPKRSYRRREDARELPNGVSAGLRHGVNIGNAVLVDQGLNVFLQDRFLAYDDPVDFNDLPIPLRCVSTDLDDATSVTFARGSIPDAVRASVSLPAVFPPFRMGGHAYVDGGVLNNLPTAAVRDMKADVVLAVSLPLAPPGKNDLKSLVGVLARSFSVAIEAAERQQRQLADVVIMPDITNYNAEDYLKSAGLAQRGYEAAEIQRDALLKYSLSDADWDQYIAHRNSLIRGPARPILRVRVDAPDASTREAVQRMFRPLINQPVDTTKISDLLDHIRSDGGYDANYTVSYETAQQFSAESADPKLLPPGTIDARVDPTLGDIATRPVVLVSVTRKSAGPPFLLLGANVQTQTNAFTQATLEGILVDQNLGGYGSELRTTFKVGYLTQLGTEYFRPLNSVTSLDHAFFVAPHLNFIREPFAIYSGQTHLADRQLQRLTAGADIGWTNQRTQQLRAGWDLSQLHWNLTIGSDGQPNFSGQAQRARLRYDLDTQDRPLVPESGIHLTTEFGYLYSAVNSPSAPQLFGQFSYAHHFRVRKVQPPDPHAGRGHEVFVLTAEAGTLFDRNVAQPFRFTLGGPLRLSASAIDQYRGTDYFFLEPALLRRIAQLPQPLGQNIYLGIGLEAGQIHAPGVPVINRQDAYFGVVAETPLGVITVGPAIGSNGERKLVFTLGKLF